MITKTESRPISSFNVVYVELLEKPRRAYWHYPVYPQRSAVFLFISYDLLVIIFLK